MQNKEDIEYRDLVIAYKNLFNGVQGKAVLFDLLNRYHMLNSHGGDMFKEGQRSVCLDILHKANINVADIDRLLKTGE